MKKKFSKKWVKSRQPRKQRKYLLNAPLHTRAKIMACNLSTELRKKYNLRRVKVRKGDKVKVMRGMFKKTTAKVEKVDRKNYKLSLEGVKIEKKDGTKLSYPVHYSNVQIIELDLSDKKRFQKKEKKVK
jgi:large subunit ribosomal protein L24